MALHDAQRDSHFLFAYVIVLPSVHDGPLGLHRSAKDKDVIVPLNMKRTSYPRLITTNR